MRRSFEWRPNGHCSQSESFDEHAIEAIAKIYRLLDDGCSGAISHYRRVAARHRDMRADCLNPIRAFRHNDCPGPDSTMVRHAAPLSAAPFDGFIPSDAAL